ncbi:hypothetical protein [Mesonia maritima]|uniref:Uncharacterized protein n=1 Tax=Mesonia maritima TaxID=1793873 RepID=A0ABU1K7D0_9FLAO|nr:hypothetical protein [Mesonia maritima]MDR6300927.1 hypothetical protein [Mesonia maritima]
MTYRFLSKRFHLKLIFSILILLLISLSCNKIKKEESKKVDIINEIDDIEEGWTEYNRDGKRLQIEALKIEDTTFINQKIIFDSKGQIDYAKSKFFKIKLPDTLKLGINYGIAELYTFNKPFESRASSIIIDNIYPDGTLVKDTFYDNYKNLKFGVFGDKIGPKSIKGEISELLLATDKDGNGYKIKITSFFEKNIIVSE